MRTGCVIAIAIALGFSSVGRTEEARDVRAEDPATEVTASLTPEQLEIGREFLDGLEWFVSAVVHEFLTADESVEMVEEDFFELEAIVDDKLEASRPVFKSQILLLKKVGNLSEAEFATINECGEFSLREVVRNYLIQEMRTEAQEVDENSTPVLTPSLPRRIQDVVVELAKSQLSSDQLRRYVEELAARSVQRKRVAVLNLVAQLDGDLLLTPAQRDQFSKLIESEWQDSWGVALGVFAADAKFMPKLPEDKVRAILRESQRTVWQAANYNREQAGWDDDPFGVFEEDLEAEPDDGDPEASPKELKPAEPLATRD